MAVTTKKTFTAVGTSPQTSTTVFTPVGIELNNQDDLDVYVTKTTAGIAANNGKRIKHFKQTGSSNVDANHVQVNDTTGLYFPAITHSGGTETLQNYTISSDNNTITFNSALPTGAIVSIERRTRDASSNYTNFVTGSTIRAGDLNSAFDESNYTAQEARNKAFDLENKIFGKGAHSTGWVTTADIADDAVTNAKIADNSIDSEHYVDGSIDNAHIANGAVNHDKLTSDSVIEAKIANGAVTSGKIGSDAVDGAKIQDNSIDSEHYVDGSIDNAHLANGAVNHDKLTSDSVIEAKIANGAVTSGKIGSDAVDGAKIQDNSIDSEHYVDGSIDTAHLANGSVNHDKLTTDSVITAKIADNAVTSAKIAANAVTSNEIATDAVTTAKIVNGAVNHDKLTTDSVITAKIADNAVTLDKMAGLARGKVIVGDASGNPTALAVGSNGQVLKSDGTDISWGAAPSGDANQNAFSNIAVSGQTTVAADTTTDTLTIVGGTNVTVTTDASADSVTIAASGGEITVQDEGSSLSTAATTLNFVGAGVTASGTGAAKTITISGSGGAAVTTDFQYLELKAHNNTSGAFSAGSADYELVTKGTSTAVSPTQAAALLISISGIIQQPNTGTSIGSNDGFCIDGSSIHFGASLSAHPEYILYLKGGGEVTALADNSVTSAKIVDGTIVNADIADDTIAESKLDIHAAPSGTDKFLKYTANGMEWVVPSYTTNTNTQLSNAEVRAAVEAASDSNVFTDADHTKLNAIEASATADQTGAEIKSAYEGESDTNAFTDADHTKLDGIATSANNYVHPNHSGEVTSTADGATVIVDDVVDEANLKVSNTPTNGYVLTAQSGNTGGLTWAAASSGTITALNNQAANRLTTIGATTTELDGEASLTFQDTTSTGLISSKQITGRGFECPATVADDWTIAAGNNAMFPGPMTVASGKTVTVPANRTLTVV